MPHDSDVGLALAPEPQGCSDVTILYLTPTFTTKYCLLVDPGGFGGNAQ